MTGRVSHINKTKILQNVAGKCVNVLLTRYLIDLVLQLIHGCFALPTYVFYSITRGLVQLMPFHYRNWRALLPISVRYYAFYWWQPIYYMANESSFPSESKERRGHWVGVAENWGHAMTWKIRTDDTRKIIYHSSVRPATSDSPNYRLGPLHGEEIANPIIKSNKDTFLLEWPDDNGESYPDNKDAPEVVKRPPDAIIHPTDLVGRTFLKDTEEDGQRFRVQIVEALDNYEYNKNADPKHIHFCCMVNDDQYEEILSYQDILDHITKDAENPVYWKFRLITAHEGPLTPSHRNYKGSKYNVIIEWENGEITSEPLSIIGADDPVTCALYASENNLLHLDGWKRFRSIAKNHKKLTCFVNQAKLRSYRTSPKYKFGFLIPRNYEEALRLDAKFGNTRWTDAVIVEMLQMHDYNTFIDKGYKDLVDVARILPNFKKIRAHLVFDVKHDGRHKARLVADGHLTDIPLGSVYSGVVSLRGLRMLIFLAELNELETWATDIGNAYLEAVTSEKVYIIAGPEFKDLEGHVLVIYKALYGLRTFGLRWHERFADCLREMGFIPCKAEPDIWMRRNGNVYEYSAVYVDDLAIAAKYPNTIVEIFTNTYNFKLKGTGTIHFHLGMDFFREDDGTLCIEPKKYIERMMASHLQMFGEYPKSNVSLPLEHGDHPELDMSNFLNEEDTQKYQSLVGAMQWAVCISHIDITTAVMTLSSFRAAPRIGHLERAKRVYSYLSKMKQAVIRIRTDEPDLSGQPDPLYDWSYSVYGEGSEHLPYDVPEALGKYVMLTHYVDANLYHDMLTGRFVTGILHFLNKTPMDWFSKKQSTVETAMYGSEFVAARTCTEQIIDFLHSVILVYPSVTGAICSEIIKVLLIVLHILMPSSTRDTQCNCSTVFKRQLLMVMYFSHTSMENLIPLISYQNIGATCRFGQFYSRFSFVLEMSQSC
jgi:Reverse transcriptase (RNA-dependent DNA polymerase)